MDFLMSVLVRVHGFIRSLDSEEGQTLAEYGMLITIISVAVVILAILTFRAELTAAWGSATECLEALGACS